MTSAIAPCAPMASIVTRAPSSASRSRRSGMAAISFDLPATASCPSTRRWRRPGGDQVQGVAALALGVAAARGLAVDGDEVRLGLAQAFDPRREAGLEQ